MGFNPDCAVASYCGLKILAVPTCWDFPILFLEIFMNMPTSQNRFNFVFRYGFLRLATDSTAQSGFNGHRHLERKSDIPKGSEKAIKGFWLPYDPLPMLCAIAQ